jgi:hypothetical protein
MRTDRFRLRRVLLGVVAGLVALSLGFYGWVQYRQSQYQHRERAVLTRYTDDYSLCLKVGRGSYGCSRGVLVSCEHDPFWLAGKPFATAGSAPPDPAVRCGTVMSSG